MIYTDPTQAAPAIRAAIDQAHRILVLSHVNPDGDAIGSLLGATHALRALGKEVVPIADSVLPSYTAWLPGADQIVIYERGMEFPAVDLTLVVDTATLTRVGAIHEEHAQALAALPRVIVDHHVTNEGGGDLNLIAPKAASTAELLFALFRAMDVPVNPAAATCLLIGLVTDTQSFQTSSTYAESLRIAADLLECEADHRRVVDEVYYALPASSAALMGKALAGLQYDDTIAWVTITQEMLQTTGAEDEAVDEVVRLMQRIGGLRALVMFKERENGTTKISLRARPPLNVAALARVWGGGGHAQAAGAFLPMPPAEAEREVLPRLRALIAEAG